MNFRQLISFCVAFSLITFIMVITGLMGAPGCEKSNSEAQPQPVWEIKILSPNGEPVRTWETHNRPDYALHGTQVYWKTDDGLYVYTTAPTLIEEKRK